MNLLLNFDWLKRYYNVVHVVLFVVGGQEINEIIIY